MEGNERLNSRKQKINWRKWEKLSEKAKRSDTWGKGCGHTCWQIPFNFSFLTMSNFIFAQALACPLLEECQAVDEWWHDKDFLHLKKYEPPLIRPVNYKNALVLNKHGQIVGPTTQKEWLIHSQKMLDIFFEIINDNSKYNETTKQYWWSQLFFRHNSDFTAGLYSQFTPIFLQIARFLPTEYVKHRSYADVHSGSDLFENIMPTDIGDAKQFRQSGKMFNITEPHKTNCRIRGLKIKDMCPKKVQKLREEEKSRFKKLTAKMKNDSTDLTDFKVNDESDFESWYRPIRNIPMRLLEKTVKPALFKNNEEHVQAHWKTCLETIEKFLNSGAIKLMPESYKPKLSATFVLANAESEHKSARACYDGGPYKVRENIKYYSQITKNSRSLRRTKLLASWMGYRRSQK